MKFTLMSRFLLEQLAHKKHNVTAQFLRLLITLAVLPLMAPSTFAQGSYSNNNQAHTVRGTVINSVTHEPIGRALVYSSDNRFATMTDSQGRFEFPIPASENSSHIGATAGVGNTLYQGTGQVVISNGPGVLLAKKPGFLTDYDQEAQYLQRGGEVTLSLMPEALIVGRVMLPSYDGVTPVQLQLYRRQVNDGRGHWVPVADTTTRSNGEFRFAELAPGTYKLLTLELSDDDPEIIRLGPRLHAYPPAYFPAATNFAGATEIRLSAGNTFRADLSPVRQLYYPVKIPVLNSAPAVPIDVRVLMQGHRGPGFSLGYNQQAQTIEGSLPNGVYTVEAASYGQPLSNGTLNIAVRGGPVTGPPMIMTPNGSIQVNLHEEFTLNETAGQSGVRDTSGNVMTGIRRVRGRYVNVTLQPVEDFGLERDASLRPPIGPKDESLIIEGVHPGRYWVRVDSGFGFAYPSTVTSGGIDLLRQPLVVAPGGAPAIEITMRNDTAALEGTIEGLEVSPAKASASGLAGGEAYPGGLGVSGYVYCIPLPDSSGQFTQGSVNQNGEFAIPKLAPGAYRMLAFRRQQPELEYRDPEAMRAYDSKGLVVRLVPGQEEHLRLALISAGG